MNLGEYFKQVEARSDELDRAIQEAKQRKKEREAREKTGRMPSLKEHILGPSCTEVFKNDDTTYDPRTGRTYIPPEIEITKYWKSPRSS